MTTYSYSPITDDIRRRISHALGDECMVTNQDEIGTYSRDASGLSYPPELVVRVQETAQIQRLMRLANEYRFPVTPRGGGSGLAGGCLPVFGGVVLSLEKLNRIISVDTQNLIAQVQPGTITKDYGMRPDKKNSFSRRIRLGWIKAPSAATRPPMPAAHLVSNTEPQRITFSALKRCFPPDG